MPQFHQKSEQLTGIQERPAGSGSNPGPGLQHAHSGLCQLSKYGIDVAYLEKNMVDPAAGFIEKVFEAIAALERLN